MSIKRVMRANPQTKQLKMCVIEPAGTVLQSEVLVSRPGKQKGAALVRLTLALSNTRIVGCSSIQTVQLQAVDREQYHVYCYIKPFEESTRPSLSERFPSDLLPDGLIDWFPDWFVFRLHRVGSRNKRTDSHFDICFFLRFWRLGIVPLKT
jgi:hypothetical protein